MKIHLLTYEKVFTSSTQNSIATRHKLGGFEEAKGNASGSPKANGTVLITIIVTIILIIVIILINS